MKMARNEMLGGASSKWGGTVIKMGTDWAQKAVGRWAQQLGRKSGLWVGFRIAYKMGVRPFFIHFHPLFLSHLFSYPKSALNSLLSLMKKHGGVLPCRPETGDGEGVLAAVGRPVRRRHRRVETLFYFIFLLFLISLLLPTSDLISCLESTRK